MTEYRQRALAAQGEMNVAYETIASIVAFANASNHRNTYSALRRIEGVVDGLRAGKVDAQAFARAESSLELLLPRVDRLVSAVRSRLLAGPDQTHAINRLTTYLERFEHATLRDAMCAARSAERVLQDAVDRFLFVAEGLYPVTHMVAGRGLVDTLAEAEASGMPSILIELKQIVKNATEGKVRKAVDDALAQADHYSKHLRSHPRWAAHEVFCIVVYAGLKRFPAVADPRVRLVYLGETTPSGKRSAAAEAVKGVSANQHV
jgi:histone H3/H4